MYRPQDSKYQHQEVQNASSYFNQMERQLSFEQKETEEAVEDLTPIQISSLSN